MRETFVDPDPTCVVRTDGIVVHYVAGVLFNYEKTRCVMVRKARPAWQAGFLNAVGGHIELGEMPHEAMRREFMEETGMGFSTWQPVLELYSPPAGHIYFFKSFATDALLDLVKTQPLSNSMVEPILVLRIVDLLTGPDSMIPNLRWILPVMMCEGIEPFVVRETLRGGGL